MSAINAIAGGSAPQSAGFSGLSSDEFMKVVLEELGQQDPLKPSDTGALLKQMASIRAIQADLDLETSLKGLVSQNQLASATGMIGRFVSGITDDNQRAGDIVLGVTNTREGPLLNLASGLSLRMTQVDEVVAADLIAPPAEDPPNDDPQGDGA